MRKIGTALLVFALTITAFGQSKSLKGDGQIFWQEDFNWADPDSPRGWSLPDGWIIEDNSHDDTGYVWNWTKDSMQGPFSRRDGGYILNSTTGDNGFLAIDLDFLNAGISYMEMLYVNSSITLPVMDLSDHPSVILELEQMFKYFNSPRMVIEVSNDDGAHWAEFDLKMGTGSGVNTQNLANTEVARYMVNLSEVAAGQSAVTIKITWDGSMLYFWMIDDLILREGWDYDLKMNHAQVSLMDDQNTMQGGFMYMMPKTQIVPLGQFEGSVINYGDQELWNAYFNVTINKNQVEQFSASSEVIPNLFFGDPADTLTIAETYTPVDYGHYELIMGMYSEEEDQILSNNISSYYFHITDSVFARTPDEMEAHESPWRSFYQYTHEGDYMGVEFNPTHDCEASSISAYISKANEGADFRFALLEIETGEGGSNNIVELLGTETMTVDSAVLEQGWVTLPLELDGVGEKMVAGARYIAAVQFWTYIEEDDLVNRGNTFWVGSTITYPGSEDKQWLYESYNDAWTQGSKFNKMIRLNINNHENIIDGIHRDQQDLVVGQNYPNPFAAFTDIPFELNQQAKVTFELKDALGRVVYFEDLGFLIPGKHNYQLQNNGFAKGNYSYSLLVGEARVSRSLVIR